MKAKVTLSRSLIGRKPNQVKTALSLGLKRIGDNTVLELNAVNIGKLNTIRHLLSFEETK